MGLGHYNGTKAKKIEVAKQIIDLAIGEGACHESKIRLARRYNLSQLEDILFLFESFQEQHQEIVNEKAVWDVSKYGESTYS